MFYSPFENATNELSKIKEEIAEENLIFSEELACPNCKTRLSDLLETGYVGCAKCYEVFSKELADMIYDFHKSAKHVGKRPEKLVSKAKIQKEIEQLEEQKRDALEREDFLLAQSIKEKISQLRGEL
ncbi:MAG: UvrB/UvrC motif-containing protein [Clostridia bacterium]|nr:UvrB/UvrC motif-containing protein [Clostridia bacterium]